MKKFSIIVILFSAVFAPSLFAAKKGGTLTFARYQEPLTLDPFIPADNGSIWALEQICDSLTEPGDTGNELVPGLAESWDISKDGLTYTFHLREATHGNGDPVTASDAHFSITKISDPNTAYGFVFDPVETMEVLDSRTLRIKLKHKYSPLASGISLFSAAVVSQKAYEADPEAFGENPTCSGAFLVESFKRGDRLVLVANENHWDGRPYLDRVEMLYIPEGNARVIGLKSGDYDVITGVPYSQAKAIGSTAGLNLEVQTIFKLDYVYLNHDAAPINNKDIRLALNYAANREAIMKAVYFGYGEIPNGYMPKMMFTDPDVKPIPYDMAKAKELVAKSYDGTKIELNIDSGNAPSKQIATILQQGWTEAGLNVEIVEADGGTNWGKIEKGDYQATVSYITSDINDDDELAILQADYTGGAKAFFTNYNNPEVTSILRKAREESAPAERAKLYSQAQEIVVWDGYSVPLNYTPAMNAYHDHVKGWRNLTTGWWWLRDVWLDK